ncbi:hypothetical protein [Mesorhizobium sp. Cs1299R1N3]|uniref:hypothetical protein n=1 Tax=Mesorhizobium sp. Cs1299R1N3 TaxID=3015173 RepID=UPI00301BE82A
MAALTDPGRAVSAAIALYGQEAATAAAYCALEANFAGRAQDFRFLCLVFRQLAAEEAIQ